MKNFKGIILLALALLVTACYKPETTLYVVGGTKAKLGLLDEDKNLVVLNEGAYEGKFKFYKEQKFNPSEGKILPTGKEYAKLSLTTNKEKMVFKFNVVKKDSFLYTNAPVRIKSEDIGQPVDLIVSREVEKELDRIDVRIMNPKTEELLATMQLINQNGKAKKAYDKEKGEFLQSYQRVRMSQRSIVFEIQASVRRAFTIGGMEWTGVLANNIINYGAAVYISPWVYSRYYKVNWILDYEPEGPRWQKALSEAPVVDYVAWVHSGGENLRDAWLENKKEHQLRMVYSGACGSGTSSQFIKYHNAAVASGHKSTSASPIFQFAVFRNWAYGRSFKGAVKAGWNRGKLLLKLLGVNYILNKTRWGYWDSTQELLDDSEIGISYTKEMKASDLDVTTSAAPKRKNKSTSTIIKEYVTEFVFDEEETEFIKKQTEL